MLMSNNVKNSIFKKYFFDDLSHNVVIGYINILRQGKSNEKVNYSWSLSNHIS
jgi:hypothetical protein